LSRENLQLLALYKIGDWIRNKLEAAVGKAFKLEDGVGDKLKLSFQQMWTVAGSLTYDQCQEYKDARPDIKKKNTLTNDRGLFESNHDG